MTNGFTILQQLLIILNHFWFQVKRLDHGQFVEICMNGPWRTGLSVLHVLEGLDHAFMAMATVITAKILTLMV